ncbi:hypothetical protein GWN49_05945, partial [Candidatus Bathyarchaeota archaeon]|nr:hypothetical protein [Candidatus Bathyarchaeota archaeon]
ATDGEYSLSAPSKVIALRPERKKTVTEYLKMQGRFRHLFKPEFEHVIGRIQETVNKRWQKLLGKCNISSSSIP